ncbi:MAG: YcxB family protein, partial [Candidatus Promineifilaceae bacterium]
MKVEENSRPELFTNRTMRLTVGGLESISEIIENKVKWPFVDKVDITPTNTFVSIGGTYAYINPKSAVTTGNYDDFVAALRASTQIKR